MLPLVHQFKVMPWIKNAACLGSGSFFFGKYGERFQTRKKREAIAALICADCSVFNDCRKYARENGEYGFWAGENEFDRARAGYYSPGSLTGSRKNSYLSYLKKQEKL